MVECGVDYTVWVVRCGVGLGGDGGSRSRVVVVVAEAMWRQSGQSFKVVVMLTELLFLLWTC